MLRNAIPLEPDMADRSTPSELQMQDASAHRPLFAALSRLWSPAAEAPAADPDLGYESALPWTLAENTTADLRPPYV